eukprot:5115871-Alexandrium_andersonii.AAC.1
MGGAGSSPASQVVVYLSALALPGLLESAGRWTPPGAMVGAACPPRKEPPRAWGTWADRGYH